jgi:hypothetical protein
VRILRSGLLSVLALGSLLVCLGGSSGCDSKPADGTMVEGGAPVSAEQKAKIKSFYADRHKGAEKKPAGQTR